MAFFVKSVNFVVFLSTLGSPGIRVLKSYFLAAQYKNPNLQALYLI